MTALRFWRDAAPVDATGDGAVWDDMVTSAERSECAVADATHPPLALAPAPAPLPACLVAGDGTRLVGGLSWETASGPETPRIGGNAVPFLRVGDRRAQLPGDDGERCGSLLLAMAAALPALDSKDSGPWAFIAELPRPDGEPLLWMGIADVVPGGDDDDGNAGGTESGIRVTPRPGPEEIFEDPDEALAGLKEHLDLTALAGLAVSWLQDMRSRQGHMIRGITELAETLPLHDVDPGAEGSAEREASGKMPVFVRPRKVPVRLVGGIAFGTMAVLAGVFVVVPMIEEAFRAPPPPPQEMVSVQVAPGAFAAACSAALDAWWPRTSGWKVANAGCAMSGHLPEAPDLPEPRTAARTGRPIVIWRQLVPEPGRNQVLARSAADQMIATWPHDAQMDAGGLALWKTETLPLVQAETGGSGDRPDIDAARSRLAALWADAPNAVRRPGENDRDSDLITIRTAAASTPAATFERAARVPGIAPVRLVQSTDGEGVLVLAPVISREMPASLFEGTGGGTAG